MQFQRALTVGKLLLGHNLVNLCSLRILPYLTQPDTVTQECGPSLWPLVRRSPRVGGHSGEAAPASLRPRRASRAVLTRRLGRRGARGHAVLRPAEPGPPSGKCPRQVGFRRRSLRSARATAAGAESSGTAPLRLIASPRASVLGAPSLVSIPKGPRDRASPTPVGPSSGPRAGRFSPQVAGGALGAGR